jgi:hypothetical protein
MPTGGTLELASAYSGAVTFAGVAGTLKLDHSSTFTGKIAGQLATGDIIDLSDITAGANATIGLSGNNSPGTLTVSDGTHTASIACSATTWRGISLRRASDIPSVTQYLGFRTNSDEH